jgi:hypothetical protein
VKAQVTLQIYSILKESGMKRTEMAKVLGVSQPQVPLVMRNRVGNLSVGRLMEFFDGAAARCGDYGPADAEGAWGGVGRRGLEGESGKGLPCRQSQKPHP